MNLKNSGDSTGFEPMTSAMPVQCSNQLSYKVTQMRAAEDHIFILQFNIIVDVLGGYSIGVRKAFKELVGD